MRLHDLDKHPEYLIDWVLNFSLDFVVSCMLLGGVVAILFFSRKNPSLKQRAVLGAFAGFFISLFALVALLALAELFRFLSL